MPMAVPCSSARRESFFDEGDFGIAQLPLCFKDILKAAQIYTHAS